ncbi:DUF3231 family protein [Lentibacillus halodurans]|uniref:DUF3231 family protein n=1 Tax=Lentibacillus halodurans TaxID=237679 RepID=UPI000B7EFF04
MMKNKSQPNPRLTSAELANLWTSYMNDSMAICVIKHFLANAQDKDVIPILKYALDLSQKHINEVSEIFQREAHIRFLKGSPKMMLILMPLVCFRIRSLSFTCKTWPDSG